jgi:hypothetical protein
VTICGFTRDSKKTSVTFKILPAEEIETPLLEDGKDM